MPNCEELSKQLMSLDQLSARTADTIHVFYMKRGQTEAKEILENAKSSSRVHPLYLEFLRALGWPVDVAMHIGWTGNFETSWKISGDMDLRKFLLLNCISSDPRERCSKYSFSDFCFRS